MRAVRPNAQTPGGQPYSDTELNTNFALLRSYKEDPKDQEKQLPPDDPARNSPTGV